MRYLSHIWAVLIATISSSAFAAPPPTFTFDCNAVATWPNPVVDVTQRYLISWTGKKLIVLDQYGEKKEMQVYSATDFSDDANANAVGGTPFGFIPAREDDPKKPHGAVRYLVVLWEGEPVSDSMPALIKAYPHTITVTEFRLSGRGFVLSHDITDAKYCSLSGELAQ